VVELAVGDNVITLTATNNQGKRTDSITVVRKPAGDQGKYPDVEFTWPERDESVLNPFTEITITGTSVRATNDMTLYNLSQGTSVTVSAAADWTASNQTLTVGWNAFYVEATNEMFKRWAEDDAGRSAYVAGWTNGQTSGTELEAWNLAFTGTASNYVGGTPAMWNLYAPSGSVVRASRRFGTRLYDGDRFKTTLAVQQPQIGGKAGMSLRNQSGEGLVEVYREAGKTNYMMSDRRGAFETGVPASNSVQLSFNLMQETNYLAILEYAGSGKAVVFGTLQNPLLGSAKLEDVQYWNSGCGAGVALQFSPIEIWGGIDVAYTRVWRDPREVLPVWINEIHYANTGPDVYEGVEIAGLAGTDLSGYELVFYSSGNEVETNTHALSGSIEADVQACDSSYGAYWFGFGTATNAVPNNPSNGWALVYKPLTQLVNYVTWGGSVTGSNGPAEGIASEYIGDELAGTPVGYSLQLVGMGTNYQAFTWTNGSASRGTLNAGQFVGTSTNGTGLPDCWWNTYFAGQSASAFTDNDVDGYNNKQEFLAGTDPTDPDSHPEIYAISDGAAGVTISFPVTPLHDYTLWWTPNLMQPISWQVMLNQQAQYGSSNISMTITNSLTNAFFRMQVTVPGWE
jgi:hypothetical protein